MERAIMDIIEKLKKRMKELEDRSKILEENDTRRANQYTTIFREFRKAKGRLGHLESQAYTRKEEVEKLFTHIGDEMTAIQSTLDFFTCEGNGEDEITGHEEIVEPEEEKKKEIKQIMGINFSDEIIQPTLLPEKTGAK